MQFTRLEPPKELNTVVECYWIATDEDPTPVSQKIIPDGFPEIIFHFGDPYRIKLDKHWEVQEKSLLAGQITKFFFLENTGASDMIGIKLKPTAVTRLFNLSMDSLNDQVAGLSKVSYGKFSEFEQLIRSASNKNDQLEKATNYLKEATRHLPANPEIEIAVNSIFESAGTCTVSQLLESTEITERQLQRLFKKHVGLSPKFYSRVIRFSHIFQLAQEKKLSWSEVGLEAGFYDQPHFIKNFKAFTGEDPTRYFFDDPTLANFFMKKS